MANHIYKCNNCKIYTLKTICPNCSSSTTSTRPAKYSPEDKYGIYRRKARQHDMENKEAW